jgi:hypothetical protein
MRKILDGQLSRRGKYSFLDSEIISPPELNLTMNHPDAHELVMTYGWNTTAYQILNPGLEYWCASHEPAVVACIRRQNVLLVAGAPVCAADAPGTMSYQARPSSLIFLLGTCKRGEAHAPPLLVRSAFRKA